MSGGVGALAGGYGLMNTLIANSSNTHNQLDTITEQASSGLIANTYAGLGQGASTSLDLNPQIASLTTYQANIGAVTGQMTVTQNAMTQLQQIAAKFSAYMPDLNALNSSEIDSIAANAQQALTQVADLLDTQDGQVYVFAGQDSSNPPVPDPGQILTSNFYTQINAAVTSLSANGSDATIASTLQTASSNDPGTSPFSAYLSQPASSISPPQIDTGNGNQVQYGMLASANSTAASTGTSTTGSYMRDLMRALATLGSMSSSQANDPNFNALVQDTQSSLTGVVSAMGQDAGAMGDRQTALTAEQTAMAATQTALTSQVSNAQDVDMAATLSKLTSTQTQLQISYKLINTASTMSLVNYLPA